jgi:hypothetical protein
MRLYWRKLCLVILLTVGAFSITSLDLAQAQSTKKDAHKIDLTKSKNTVDRIRQPDPPQVPL